MTGTPEEFDVLLIGCGLRGTGLLTAVPELMDWRLGIVEAGPKLGPGSFELYRIQSNSAGSDFFGWVKPDGPFSSLLQTPKVRSLREQQGAFELKQLASVLECFGEKIRQMVGSENVILGDPTAALHVESGMITCRLRSGRQLRSRHVVLATGIRESPHPDLQAWRGKTVLSSDVIRGGVDALQRPDHPSQVVIVGSSHSTYAVVRLIHEANLRGSCYEAIILHRSPVKLFYSDRDSFDAQVRFGIEAIPNPAHDICPETGNIFRYSGLRHGARDMFRAIAAGAMPTIRHQRMSSIAAASPVLDAAGLVVQATGYESNTLELWVDGKRCQMRQRGPVVEVHGDGRLMLPMESLPNIFVMGMDPYPYGDNSLTPSGQYARRGAQLLRALNACSAAKKRDVQMIDS